MAVQQFRPGAYLVKETSGNEDNFKVDYDDFNIPPNGELEVNPSIMLSFDTAGPGTIKVYRIAPKPFTIANSTGGNK